MASVSPRRSAPSWPLAIVIIVGLMIVVGAALFLYVLIAGQITVPFTDPPRVITFGAEEQEAPWEPPAGSIAVPVSGRVIPAYHKLTRDDIWDPEKGDWAVVWLKESTVADTIIRDFRQLRGRVMAHEKRPGYAFTEDDFLPKGTRPGVVGGIPPGMRAMRVRLEQVRGLYGLNPGDRFDIVAAIALDGDPTEGLSGYGGVYSDRVALESKLGNLGKQATVNVIVQNGAVVTPVETVMVPTAQAGLMGRRTGTRPVQEVVVAVRPDEVAPLTEALAVGANLSVVPRSGHPEDDATSMTPSSSPRSPFAKGEGTTGGMQLVETIGGSDRELVPVPEMRKTPGDAE
jgi:Flp pilus assembly protein CpaB